MKIFYKIVFIFLPFAFSCSTQQPEKTLDNLTLKNYRPKSVYNIQKTNIEKASFPIIDMHSHDYASNEQEIEQWVETMKKMGISSGI